METDRKVHDGLGFYSGHLLKWVLAGLIMGAVGGVVGGAFHECVELASGLRAAHPWLLYLLPAGGVVIALLYKLSRTVLDTNLVMRAVHSDSEISPVMLPLIFVSSVISHLLGASVGREGAALQMGGALGYQFSRLFRLKERDKRVMVMCGMSAVFAANFGTPVAAAVFAIEVVDVGIMYYSGLVPCLVSALTAAGAARLLGVKPMAFAIASMAELSALNLLRVGILGVLCAALGIVFCRCLHNGERLAKKLIPNPLLRIAALGAVIILLTWLCGEQRYNGAGGAVIASAVAGQARWEDFLLKLTFTVVSISAGYKGGEIVPTLFVGSAFGCVAGPLLGLDAGFAAAICMVALLCAMVNCPLASVLIGMELFGGAGLPFFALACAVSYLLSGRYSLYHEQGLVYSKVSAMRIDEHTK